MDEPCRVELFAGEPERAVAGPRFAEDGEVLCSYGCAGLVDGCPYRTNRVLKQPIVAITSNACCVYIVVACTGGDECW